MNTLMSVRNGFLFDRSMSPFFPFYDLSITVSFSTSSFDSVPLYGDHFHNEVSALFRGFSLSK